MTDARSILDQRLARGEISTDEHQRLTESLATTEPDEPPPPRGSWSKGGLLAGCAILAVLLSSMFKNTSAEVLAECEARSGVGNCTQPAWLSFAPLGLWLAALVLGIVAINEWRKAWSWDTYKSSRKIKGG